MGSSVMPGASAKVAERLSAGIKKFQQVIADIKARDVAESDTVIVVTDMLCDVFGYEKYSDITSEHAIKGTYCDLAIKVEAKLRVLIEVKAVGTDLKEAHVKQAIDYAANAGCDWVVLTNSAIWRIYRVLFEKPIDQELVIEVDFLALKPKADADIEMLYLLCKEAWDKSALDAYETQRQALGRFILGAVILGEPVLKSIRKELKRICPDVKIDIEEISKALETDVLKREIFVGEKAESARKKVAKLARAAERALEDKTKESGDE
jgi:hypothetical protein